MRTLIATMLLASSLFAQKMEPYNVEFDPTVSLTPMIYNGKQCLVAIWDPSRVNLNGERYTFAKFYEQPTNNLRFHIEGAVFLNNPQIMGSGCKVGIVDGSWQVGSPWVRTDNTGAPFSIQMQPGGTLEYPPGPAYPNNERPFKCAYGDPGIMWFPYPCFLPTASPSSPDLVLYIFHVEPV